MSTKSWAVIDDREHYKTLKYMYVAPIHIPMYLFGRGVAKFIVGSISVLITIVFGMLFLHLRIELAAVNWPLSIQRGNLSPGSTTAGRSLDLVCEPNHLLVGTDTQGFGGGGRGGLSNTAGVEQ